MSPPELPGDPCLAGGYVLNPDPSVVARYRISPFRTQDIAFNLGLPAANAADDYFRARFRGRRFVYCNSGRQAIRLALGALELGPGNVVTILTTTGNLYISGCVTREIERVCGWSRQAGAATRALLVNHEFGLGFEDLRAVWNQGLPVIEDAAHSFLSDNAERSVGSVGEFLVLSFPKFFPIQFGGLLVFDERFDIAEPIDEGTGRYLKKVISFHLPRLEIARERRRANHAYLAERFAGLGCTPRFRLPAGAVPGVFMFRAPSDWNLPALKEFLGMQGVECSVFYGEQAFFIPVNDRLEVQDLDFFYEAVRAFTMRTGSGAKTIPVGVVGRG